MTLNEVMKDTADAIREKKGTTDLIAPVDFAEEIKGITAGGGGTDLEGEYFLAKPNGRYWKFTFMPEGYRLRIEDFEPSQIDAMDQVYNLLLMLQNVYGAAVSSDDIGFNNKVIRLDGFYNIGFRMNNTFEAIERYKEGYEYNYIYFNEGFLRVWKECDVKMNPNIENMEISLDIWNLVELTKAVARFEGMELTDDEAISFMEQAFMLIPATEEEYKYWRIEYEE